MSRIKLRKEDLACLGRLNTGPLEIGDIPEETVARLTARGLIVQVLGCCEITPAGQLIYHRQYFLRTPRSRVAHVTRSNPLFLQEMHHGTHPRRSRLRRMLSFPPRLDTRIRLASELPQWLIKFVSGSVVESRPAHGTNKVQAVGRTHGVIKTD